ncbi:MAG TPA: hypothetical protein VLA79_14920 [Polyangia bacterium]|nr:hypothetical protein [Polyangia bacterium]
MKSQAVLFTLLIASAAGACGRGVVPGAAYDQPLLSFSGTINPAGGLDQVHHPVVGLLWTDPLQRSADVTMPGRWLQSTVDPAADTFTVDIFRPPPPEAVVELAAPSGKSSQQLAMAEIVIVDDSDDDGGFLVQGPRATIAAPERYLAGSANVLTYVENPFPAPQSNSPLTLPAQIGYALVNYNCQGQLSAGTNPVNPQKVEMILQPSQDFPDVRTCRASHGP